MKHKLSKHAEDFIDDSYLEKLIAKKKPEKSQIDDILAKALEKKPLTVEETAVLTRTENPEMVEKIFSTARQLKQDVYGNRIVIFAPLYLGNKCINDCKYCAFRVSNTDVVRKSLTKNELTEQVEALIDNGHKRLILVWGEHPDYNARRIAENVQKVYSVKKDHGKIRRVNINAAPQNIEDYKIIKDAGIGTFQIFQETYHHATYRKFHPRNTQKGDYLYRLDGLDRAMEAGIDDVGIGALFGLYDWRFDLLGLVKHANHLRDKYNVGCHTISFPRLCPAFETETKFPHVVNDYDFKRIIAILRLAVPYTGLILTAREKPEIRKQVMEFGVSQIDAGSRIELGGYTHTETDQKQDEEQFELGDIRSLDTVMKELMEDDFIPSFCTACYRLGRTGEQFMEFAIPGFINRYCTPNALSTLQEYLVDYASSDTKKIGEKLIKQEIRKIEDDSIKKQLATKLHKIKRTDARDLYF